MLTTNEIIIRLLIGTLLGGIIGFERQAHGRPAGLRTQLLVCVACVLLMIMSEHYYAQSTMNAGYIRFDPTRIAAGAMTGVGFLGAGVILKTGFTIQGLTTAACIWIVAAIGLAIGAGQYVAGTTGFIITFFSLWVLRIFEERIPRQVYKYITFVTDESGDEETIKSLFIKKGFEISKMEYEIEFPGKEKTFIFTIATKNRVEMKEIIESISGLGFVKRLEIKG
ncbi:MAG: MgtC/SapB family protein [Nitrospirota bacterium]